MNHPIDRLAARARRSVGELSVAGLGLSASQPRPADHAAPTGPASTEVVAPETAATGPAPPFRMSAAARMLNEIRATAEASRDGRRAEPHRSETAPATGPTTESAADQGTELAPIAPDGIHDAAAPLPPAARAIGRAGASIEARPVTAAPLRAPAALLSTGAPARSRAFAAAIPLGRSSGTGLPGSLAGVSGSSDAVASSRSPALATADALAGRSPSSEPLASSETAAILPATTGAGAQASGPRGEATAMVPELTFRQPGTALDGPHAGQATAARPFPAARGAASAPELVIDQLDVRVITEPRSPAPARRSAAAPGAPRGGAWTAGARRYLGRL